VPEGDGSTGLGSVTDKPDTLSVMVYKDVLQPAAKEVGAALETVAKTVQLALAPLKLRIWSYEQIEKYFLPLLAERLQTVAHERIITPDPMVAGPTIEALRYAGHKPSLRELYVNLLAASMDAETARKAHPGFVEIIRQLTPDDARILRLLASREALPLVTIRAIFKQDRGYIEVKRHFSLVGHEAGCSHPELTAGSLDNLCRLGLAEIPDGKWLSKVELYEPLEKHPEVLQTVSQIEKSGDKEPNIERKVFRLTDWGKQFCDACIAPEDSNKESTP